MAMSEQTQPVAGAAASTTKARTSFGILGAISLSHLLNDMIQSLILAIYPLLQSEFSLTFMQIGMITLTFQLASSLLQPVVGYWTDKYPMPWSLPIGMCFTLSGLVLLALAEWGNRHFAPEGRQMQLVEMATQRHVEPVMVDKATGEEIIPGKYAMVPGPAASPLMKYRHEYLLRKREGDSGQKFQPEPYRDASNESDQ